MRAKFPWLHLRICLMNLGVIELKYQDEKQKKIKKIAGSKREWLVAQWCRVPGF